MSNEFVLTAAHCVEGFEAKYEFRLLVCSTSKKDMFDESKLHEISSNRIIHEKYEMFEAPDANFPAYDFMILKLLKKLSLCLNNFARLPTPDMDDQLLEGKTLLTSGWGAMIKMSREQIKEFVLNPRRPIPKEVFPDRLRILEIPYLPNEICQKRFHNFFTKEYKDLIGTKNTLKKSLNFESKSESDAGGSMLCASMCDKGDISECKMDNSPCGSCIGDSGCKYFTRLSLLCLIYEAINRFQIRR